mmetsp:Transcript_49231/g.74897  ORF Transcript_49231/g.74897 Transcript_49231/m.74897 type:complete len:218 (-) Transcript_49231:230-883(-)
MAPEIPAAMYRSGATTLPVCPTCQSLGQNPASTAARDAPTAAPNLSARASKMGKLSPLLIPRPPLTTIPALDKSGRSDLLTLSPAHFALSKAATPSTVSTPAASTSSALSKLVGRIEMTLIPDPFDTTLANTLPAYMGRTNVLASSISKISVMGDASNKAAARGMTVDPNLEDVPTTILQSLLVATASIAAATDSANLSPIATWYTLETPAGTWLGA